MHRIIIADEYTCDKCGIRKGTSISLSEDATIPKSTLPTGWTQINQKHICPNHDIYVSERLAENADDK